MIRRTAIAKKRPTLRKGEPTSIDKATARHACFDRAQGKCERCSKVTGWTWGHLHHERGKRRWGWGESEFQRHVWLCPACHGDTHAPKACPKADWRDTIK